MSSRQARLPPSHTGERSRGAHARYDGRATQRRRHGGTRHARRRDERLARNRNRRPCAEGRHQGVPRDTIGDLRHTQPRPFFPRRSRLCPGGEGMTDTRSDERVTQAEMGDPSNVGKEVTTSAPRDNARAQQLKNLRDGVLADVEAHRGDLTQILNATGGDYETFVAGLRIFMMRTMQDNASFFEGLTAVSFMEALMRCARDGLVPDGKEAAISAF